MVVLLRTLHVSRCTGTCLVAFLPPCRCRCVCVCVRLRGFSRGAPELAGFKTTLGRHQHAHGGGGELSYWSPLPSTAGPVAIWHWDAPFPFSTPYRILTSLNFTPLNSIQLDSLCDPPGPPFWSLSGTQIDLRSAPSRLLTTYFLKNVNFHEMQFRPGETHSATQRRVPKRPKICRRRLQDDLKLSASFLMSILVPLGSDFGLILAPVWASQTGPSRVVTTPRRAQSDLNNPWRPKTDPRRPQDPTRAAQDPPRPRKDPARPPKTIQNPPKTPPKQPKVDSRHERQKTTQHNTTTEHNTGQNNTPLLYTTLGGSYSTGLP